MSDPVQHGVMLINPSTGNVTLNLYPFATKGLLQKKLRENSIFFTLLITTIFIAYNHSVTGEAVSSGPAPLGTGLLTAQYMFTVKYCGVANLRVFQENLKR